MKREKNRISATNAGSVPLCIVIAGPNGAGKTTFATEYLVHETGVLHFINVDLIAGGLSPLQPELANVLAGRIFLEQWSRLVSARASFAFETTMSGLTLSHRLCALRAVGRTSCVSIVLWPTHGLSTTIRKPFPAYWSLDHE